MELSDSVMRIWVERKWKTMLRYMPTVVCQLRGWYRFHFLSQEDLAKIKYVPWINGKSFLRSIPSTLGTIHSKTHHKTSLSG